MAGSIDRVKQDIQARLEELESERDQLLRALEALTGGRVPLGRRGRRARSGSAKAARNGRKRGARRAPRGQRRQQVLDVLKGKELGPSGIAREIGVNPTQISGLLRQLASDGIVARTDGGKWRLTGSGVAPASASPDTPQTEAGASESSS